MPACFSSALVDMYHFGEKSLGPVPMPREAEGYSPWLDRSSLQQPFTVAEEAGIFVAEFPSLLQDDFKVHHSASALRSTGGFLRTPESGGLGQET